MTEIIAWLRAHPELAYLLFLLGTGLVTEAFRKRPPGEETALRARFPRAVALRELIRGFGWDGPKIRGALAVLLLGRFDLAPLATDTPAPPTPRDPGLYPPPGQASGPDDTDPRGVSTDPERTPRP